MAVSSAIRVEGGCLDVTNSTSTFLLTQCVSAKAKSSSPSSGLFPHRSETHVAMARLQKIAKSFGHEQLS